MHLPAVKTAVMTKLNRDDRWRQMQFLNSFKYMLRLQVTKSVGKRK